MKKKFDVYYCNGCNKEIHAIQFLSDTLIDKDGGYHPTINCDLIKGELDGDGKDKS